MLWFMSHSVLPMLSSKSFTVSGFIFRSLVHSEYIVGKRVSSISGAGRTGKLRAKNEIGTLPKTICMHLFELWFSQGICPVEEFLGHMVDLFLVFYGISILFSIMTASVDILTNRQMANKHMKR